MITTLTVNPLNKSLSLQCNSKEGDSLVFVNSNSDTVIYCNILFLAMHSFPIRPRSSAKCHSSAEATVNSHI